MRVLVTSGGTSEKIDEIRILTNISSGLLGKEIADAFLKLDYPVTYVCGKTSEAPWPEEVGFTYRYTKPLTVIRVDDVTSLMRAMEQEVPHHDVIIHAMAVSDFGFKRENATKLKSSDPEAFIEYLRQNIVTNPKVISFIKQWNPLCRLVGFKFEVGKTFQELVDTALVSLTSNQCEIVVANDKLEMEREKEHIAYLISKDSVIKATGKLDIAQKLVEYFSKQEKRN